MNSTCLWVSFLALLTTPLLVLCAGDQIVSKLETPPEVPSSATTSSSSSGDAVANVKSISQHVDVPHITRSVVNRPVVPVTGIPDVDMEDVTEEGSEDKIEEEHDELLAMESNTESTVAPPPEGYQKSPKDEEVNEVKSLHSDKEESIVHDEDDEPSIDELDLSKPRFCIAARHCISSLNERCVTMDGNLVCGCGQRYQRDETTKICQPIDSSEGDDAEELEDRRDIIDVAEFQSSDKKSRKIYDRAGDPFVNYAVPRPSLEDEDLTPDETLDREMRHWLEAEMKLILQELPSLTELSKNDDFNVTAVLNPPTEQSMDYYTLYQQPQDEKSDKEK